MKILVVFYSRSGKTKKAAEAISEILKCDKEEIFDMKSREGIVGFLSAGTDANLRRLTAIKEIKNDPSLYDLVIIGTPIWSSNISTPVRTYLSLYKEEFKKVAFFCTRLGSDSKKVFDDMKNLSQKVPLVVLELTTREVARDQYIQKVKEFIENLKEEIFDIKSREGVVGFLSAGTDANLRRLTTIKEIKNNPSLYDLVIIGTPIWSSNISTPVRTYLSLFKEEFKKVAFFCTRLGSDTEKVFADMKNLSQKTPLALLELTSREVVRDQYMQKVKEFIKNLKEELKK